MWDEQRLAYMTSALRRRLADHDPEWRVAENGLVGPGGQAVVLREHGRGDGVHFDVGFVLDRVTNRLPVLWDCVAAPSPDPGEAAVFAAKIWADNTLPPILEIFTRQGELAAHIGPGEPGGLAGRHVVQGPALGWGVGGRRELVEWMAGFPLLDQVGDLVEPVLTGPLDLVKVMLGGPAGREVVEVTVAERGIPRAAERLLGLDWPRPAGPFFARSVQLVLTAD